MEIQTECSLWHFECISWHLSWFLATNSFVWSTPTFLTVLDGWHLQDHGFPVVLVPKFSCCWECWFIYSYRLFHCLSKLVHLLSLVLVSLPALLFCFTEFPLKNLFSPLHYFFNIIISAVVFLFHSSSLSIWTYLLSFWVFTWSLLNRKSAFVFAFLEICYNMKS